MKAISISQWGSIGDGLMAANHVSEFEDLEILECTPTGDNIFLMVDGPWAEIKKFHGVLKELNPVRERVFEKLNPRVLAAHLALDNTQIKNMLYVLEGDFIGNLFSAMDTMMEEGAECVDLRMARGGSQNSYALMTTDRELKSAGSFHNRKVRVTLISPAGQALKNFFDLRPIKI
jgi:hypothetical protein